MYSSKRACSPVKIKPNLKGSSNKKRRHNEEHVTCFTYDALKKIAQAYNRAHSTKSGYGVLDTFKDTPIPIHRSKKKLWKAIKEKMDERDVCTEEGEWCWVRQPFVKNLKDRDISYLTFKPPIPIGKYDWLSTDDIDRVMEQYEAVIPTFKFMGTWPIDFQTIARKKFMTDFDVMKFKKQGYKHVGMVLNEDTSKQSGSHWVGLLLDLDRMEAQFYDSYAEPPKQEVVNWIKYINSTLPDKTRKFEIVYNNVRHQFANSECGVYTIHFLVLRAIGTPFKSIVEKVVRDEEMNGNRHRFFNPLDKYDNW